MVKYVNECVECPHERGCIGDYCSYRNIRVLSCDVCHKEVDELFVWDFDNDERCWSCYLEVTGGRKLEV